MRVKVIPRITLLAKKNTITRPSVFFLNFMPNDSNYSE